MGPGDVERKLSRRQSVRQLLRHRHSPCKSNCPAHIAVQCYIRMAAEGRYMDALKLIKKENPFPTVCGHICNHRCDHPEATKMIRSEDKMKAILPYMIKRAAKIKV